MFLIDCIEGGVHSSTVNCSTALLEHRQLFDARRLFAQVDGYGLGPDLGKEMFCLHA